MLLLFEKTESKQESDIKVIAAYKPTNGNKGAKMRPGRRPRCDMNVFWFGGEIK